MLPILATVFAFFAIILYGNGSAGSAGNTWFGIMIAAPSGAAAAAVAIAWFLQYSHSSGFIGIPRERATRHQLYGIGGALMLFQVLVFLAAIFGPLLYVGREYGEYHRTARAANPHLAADVIRQLADSVLVDPPVVYATINIASSAALSMAGLLAVGILLAMKSPLFRPLYVGVMVASITVSIVSTVASNNAFAGPQSYADNAIGSAIVAAFMQALIGIAWTIYLYRSRRVNVTVYSSVPANDALARPEPEPEERVEPVMEREALRTTAPEQIREPALGRGTADRLQIIKDLLDRGLISADEYSEKRKTILDAL